MRLGATSGYSVDLEGNYSVTTPAPPGGGVECAAQIFS